MLSISLFLHNKKFGGWNTQVSDHSLCHSFMKGERQDKWIRKCIWDIKGLQEGRDLCLSAKSFQPFSDIEDNIPTAAVGQPPCQLPDIPYTVCLVPQFLERSINSIYCIRPVKLSGLLFTESFFQVVITEIVGNTHLHDNAPVAARRALLENFSDPTGPLGSGYRQILPS